MFCQSRIGEHVGKFGIAANEKSVRLSRGPGRVSGFGRPDNGSTARRAKTTKGLRQKRTGPLGNQIVRNIF